MKYRSEIDGLRAIAVVPVVLFHAGFEFARSGFVGVDVFFVISGYLITSILLEDLSRNQFSILRFYERRARRILPAMLFVIVVSIPFAWVLMTPSQMKNFGQSILAVSFFASNFFFWREDDYFSPEAEETPLLHMWSLSVEEQFYIVFPPLLFFLWRLGPRRAFIAILILSGLSLALSEWGWRNAPSANFYLAPFRAWELAAGSLAAFVVRADKVEKNEGLAVVGLLMVIAANFSFNASTPFPSLYTLLPVVGVVLLILYCRDGTLTARLLGSPVLVGIGLISYSAYLWHQMLFAMARIAAIETSVLIMLALSLLSFGLAAVSWRYVEQPFRGKTPLFPRRATVLGLSVALLAGFAVVGLLGHLSGGFPMRFELRDGVDQSQIAMPTRDKGYCFYSFNRESDLPVGASGHGCMLSEQSGPDSPSIIVFGDSFAAHWDPFWRRYGEATGAAVESVTTNWCFPALSDASVAPRNHRSREQCVLNREYLLNNVSRYDAVVIAGAWFTVEEGGFEEDVIEYVNTILATSSARIVILDTPVSLRRASVERALYSPNTPLLTDDELETDSRKFWSRIEATYGTDARVFLATRSMLFGNGKSLTLTGEGLPYSLEGKHISIYGATASFDALSETEEFERLARFVRGQGRSVGQSAN